MKTRLAPYRFFLLVVIILLAACGTPSPGQLANTPTINATEVNSATLSGAHTGIALTGQAIPTSTSLPAATQINLIPTLEDSPALEQPIFETEEIPGKLSAALHVEMLSEFKGHSLLRVSGWQYGFNGVNWAGADHLLLYPFAGMVPFRDGSAIGAYPTTLNLNLQSFWIPEDRLSLSWSETLGVFIVLQEDNSVVLYRPDGDVKATYTGNLYGISPSATKLLIDDTWIDLIGEKTVDFAWQPTDSAGVFVNARSQFPPIWSPDEMRVYACCYAYGDAKTGESFVMPHDGIKVDGQEVDYSLLAFGGTWVLEDKYLLPIWQGGSDDRFSSVYLLDPAAKTYRNLSELAGVPHGLGYEDQPSCNRPSAQNGGRYVWVDCLDGGHMIDLVTFHSQTFPPFGRPFGEGSFALADVEWSVDGTFARMSGDGFESILSTTSKELKTPPGSLSKFWHPTENKLLYLSHEGKVLSILDPTTMTVREQPLPIKSTGFVWSSDGQQIAFRAEDGSLWHAAYPELANLEQLTAPMPGWSDRPSYYGAHPTGKSLAWSPDGTALAFVSGTDVYVVSTGSKTEK
jgi:hypothetical protein